MRYLYSILFLLITFNISFAEDNPEDYMWLNGFGFNNFVGAEVKVVEVDENLVYTVLGNKLFRYDLSTREWKAIASISSGSINDIAIHDHYVYFCGDFKEVNGQEIWGVAVYNPYDESIRQVGNKVTGQINCLGVSNDKNLFIAGNIINTEQNEEIIFYLDNDIWTKFDIKLEGTIYTYDQIDNSNEFYIGGSFNEQNNDFSNFAVVNLEDKSIYGFGSTINGTIFAIDDASGPVIGGMISSIDGNPISNIAKWDGNSWFDLWGGVSGTVYTIHSQNFQIHAGGHFDSINGQPKNLSLTVCDFQEKRWYPLDKIDSRDYSTVFDIATYMHALVIAGSFKNAFNTKVHGLVIMWSYYEDIFTDLFENNKSGTSSLIYDFAVGEDEKLYVGGAFNNVGEETSPGFAAWNGFEWESLIGGLYAPGVVYDVESHGDDIYFSGWFPGADGVELNNIAKYNFKDEKYEGIGDGIDAGDGDMGPIILLKDTLYAGGRFVLPGEEESHGIAKWNGFEWEGVKTGIKAAGEYTPRINAFAADSSGMLYVGGRFDSLGIEYAQGLAIWNPYVQRWYGFWNAIQGTVHTILYTDDYVYLGGEITKIYSEEAHNLVRLDWRNLIWESIGDGTNGPVYSIVHYDGSLYIGGNFSEAGGKDANSIVRYDLALQEFYPLGSGIIDTYRPGSVMALQVYRDKLFVGGLFNTAGGKYSNNIAVWDGLLTSVEETPIEYEFNASIVPNPVRSSTRIKIDLPKEGSLSAGIYDFQGNEIMRLSDNEIHPAGNIEFEFNAENLSSSVYFCKIYFDGNVITKKILVIR